MKNYATYSYWLETCGDDLTPRPSFDGSIDVDVAILGAGYSGLWTAFYLLKQEPSLKVAVLEKEIAGFGASGRNGAWCTPGFPRSLSSLEAQFGRVAARNVQLAMYDAVDEVGRVAVDEGIDIQWTKGGSMRIARHPHQLPALTSAMKNYERFGLAEHVQLLDAKEANERITINGMLGAIYNPGTATIHPGRLVRGLARAVEKRGGVIYEQTEVTDYTTGARPALHTARGDVRAKTIVLCGEAYLSQLKKVGRNLIPVYSLITLTEPLSADQWSEIGWEARETVGSNRYTVDYLSKTADGRILFGGRGAPYHYRSSIKDEYDRHGPTHEMLQNHVRDWFPMLKNVKFTHTWGGPLGWPRDFMPTMSFWPDQGLASARAYTGTGIATANLSGRLLADLITGRDTDITHLPTVGHVSRDWEPEPFRWIGVRYVQRGFMKLDEKAESTGVAPDGKSLVERITKH